MMAFGLRRVWVPELGTDRHTLNVGPQADFAKDGGHFIILIPTATIP